MFDAPSYAETRQAWRDIWSAAEFDRELATLAYPRAQALLNLYVPFLPKDAPILEAGCGPAHIVHYLRERGYDLIGLDYAPEALIPTHGRLPALPLLVGDVHALPYATNALGGYLSFGVVEHFEHGPGPALAEAFRVLRPGGVLILTVPHPNFAEALKALKDRFVPAPPRAGYFERTFHHRELAMLVEKAGFRVKRSVPYGHSYTFYGLSQLFRGKGYYESSPLGELAGRAGRRLFPWQTAFECLIVALKP